jgi:hypothetical protein
MLSIGQKVIDWLLEPDNPPVRYLTLTGILNKSHSDSEVKATALKINEYSPIQTILSHWKGIWPEGKAHGYQKYRGGFWQIIFLGEMGASGDDERIRHGCQWVLKQRNKHGDFFNMRPNSLDGACLTSNLYRSLYKLGMDNDAEVLAGLEKMAKGVVEYGGAPCQVMDTSLLPDCFMTLPWLLSTFVAIPLAKRSSSVKTAIDIVAKRLLEREVFVYVPTNIEEWRIHADEINKNSAFGNKMKAVKAEKERWIQEGKISGYKEKEGWKQFGFPLHYNPDLLEGLLALQSAGIGYRPEMEKALQVVESKTLPDGKWKMDRTLNGKMLADIEQKGKPSKWVTMRALQALKLKNVDLK